MITYSGEQTQSEGEKFSKELKSSDVVFLEGDLGSGKTTFIKGVATGLGVNSRIISPTFVVVRIHKTDKDDIQRMYHLDLYRLASESDVKGVDLKDFLDDKNAVVLIEWPQISKNIVDKPYWLIKIKNLDDNKREITIEKHGQ